jgi:hypothetical protein
MSGSVHIVVVRLPVGLLHSSLGMIEDPSTMDDESRPTAAHQTHGAVEVPEADTVHMYGTYV